MVEPVIGSCMAGLHADRGWMRGWTELCATGGAVGEF